MSGNKLDDSGVMELTRNIMIVSIVALFMVMTFVVFLHLYSKWYWYRRQQGMDDHNNRRRGDFTDQRGLDASFLKTIRVIRFDPKDFKEGLECAVCLSELEVGERARILPKCDHRFHVECIDMWFHTHSTCPICRNPVSDQTEISLENQRTDGRDSQNSNSQTNVYETEAGTSTSQLEEANDHHQNPALPSEQASPSLQTYKKRARPDLVIDIPRQGNEDEEVSCSGMRSLKRILSSSTRFNPFSPGTGSGNV